MILSAHGAVAACNAVLLLDAVAYPPVLPGAGAAGGKRLVQRGSGLKHGRTLSCDRQSAGADG